MSSNKILISCASWEPRFIDGTKRLLAEDNDYNSVVCVWFTEYGDRTLDARNEFRSLTGCADDSFVELPLVSSVNTHQNRTVPSYAVIWNRINEVMARVLIGVDTFLLDITTMPRETLWIILDFLTEAGMDGEIVYHKASNHGKWCGGEPDRPHIVPKLGGLAKHGLPTKLLVATGYDEDRSEQFIACYEPSETLLMFQEGVHAENVAKNERKHRLRFGDRPHSIQFQGINCYEQDWGYSQFKEAADAFGVESNLILASLGPKTSAVGLYRLHRHLPESCLVYAPCKNYNFAYSSGIGKTLKLKWSSKMVPKLP